MEYHSIVSAVTVLPKGEAIFHEAATTISIDDECAGPFLIVSQDIEGGIQQIKITADEWPHIKSAIDQMFIECKQLEGK